MTKRSFAPAHAKAVSRSGIFPAGKFIAVDAINDSKAYMFGKKILELGRDITPEQAADAEFDLKALIR